MNIKTTLTLGFLAAGTLLADTAPMEKTVNATLWYQTSGEMRALAYQAFNVARLELDRDLAAPQKSKKKRAVIVDVDETVLDNSPYQVGTITSGQGYPKGWAQWIAKATARPLPGAVEFLNYAASKGVSVFYITNRKHPGRAATVKNLKAAGFPVNPEHVMLRKKDRSKVVRRSRVLKDHRIVLLMGDSLGDFDGIFDKHTVAERSRAVDASRADFGRRFIVLPNPMYGDWEGAVYDGKWDLSESAKAKVRNKVFRANL